ncbi:MAG: hypothetical protein GY705_30930 [Bacteroidetes bacterium]|nr:hypothetical protein [Bacteroidota bacterium]
MKYIFFPLFLFSIMVAFAKEVPQLSEQLVQTKPAKIAYLENVHGEKLFLDFYADIEGNVRIKEYIHFEKYPSTESLKPVYVKVRHIYVYFEKADGQNVKENKKSGTKELIKTLVLPSEPKLMSHIKIVMAPELTLGARHK